MKAIPTRYKGYNFRSRLEARWAVFFDALGIKWEYEPEGYELSDGTRYLPDFRLNLPSGLTTWIEVKPIFIKSDPKFLEFRKSLIGHECFDESGIVNSFPPSYCDDGYLVSGDPSEFFGNRWFLCPRCADTVITGADDMGDEVGFYCTRCDMTTPCGSGHDFDKSLAGHKCCYPHKGWMMVKKLAFDRWMNKFESAKRQSRSARFEFGECGAT